MRSISRAVADTRDQLGRWSGIFLVAAGPLLGLLAHSYLFGREDMMGEVNPIISALAGLCLAVLLLFFWNLLAAPYRIERDRADSADKLNAELLDRIKDYGKPDLRLEVHQTIRSVDYKADPSKGFFGALVTVSNIGGMPSIADNWCLEITGDDGSSHTGELFHVESVTLGESNPITYKRADFISSKTAQAIAQGQKVSGLFFAFVPREVLDAKQSYMMRLSATDVLGKRYVFERRLSEGETTQNVGVLPGMNPVLGL